MILAEIILDKRYKTKKGYPVKIRVYDNTSKLKGSKNRTYLNLNIYQESEELKLTTEIKRKEIELAERLKYCNDNLLLLNDAEKIILEGVPENDIDIEIQVLETKIELLKKKKGIQKSVGLIEFGNQLIEERKAFRRPVLSYENTLKRISKFIFPEEDVPLNSINKEWVILLDIYLKNEKLTDNSIKSYISIVRAIYKEAQTRESLLIKKENPFLKLRTFAQNKVVIDLTIDDLRKMKNLKAEDIKTKSYLGQLGVKQLADLYLFQFAIGGHDLIDVANLHWSNIVNGRVKFKRYKNRFKKSAGEEVDNKLNEFALSILEKYGDKSNSRIFTFLHCPVHEEKKYKYQIMQFNRYGYLIIAQHINSKNSFTTKSTRYLFRTEAGNLLIDSFVIMKLQGHTPQGVTFGYQGALNYEVQDREHQKILDLVFKDEQNNK